MRNWELSRQQQPASASPPAVSTQPFVTVSRMVGSGGGVVASRLAEAIGWPLFDREVLLNMAGDDGVRKRIYESLDERDLGFIEESLRSFADSAFQRNDYFRRLIETVLALARQGRAVFLGRGVDLVLPRDCGLRVRIVALPAVCAQRFAERTGMTPVDAAREIQRIERQRERFVRSHFHVKVDAPDRFDIVLNLASLSPDEAVHILRSALAKRGLLD